MKEPNLVAHAGRLSGSTAAVISRERTQFLSVRIRREDGPEGGKTYDSAAKFEPGSRPPPVATPSLVGAILQYYAVHPASAA